MKQETPEGQTHYFNDGCGEPAHNKVFYEYPKLIRVDAIAELDLGESITFNCEGRNFIIRRVDND